MLVLLLHLRLPPLKALDVCNISRYFRPIQSQNQSIKISDSSSYNFKRFVFFKQQFLNTKKKKKKKKNIVILIINYQKKKKKKK